MKKVFQINIGNNVFNIDDDAYTLLQDYLRQIRMTFTDGEVADDIEARIGELFGEAAMAGARVITIKDVNAVIATVGRPEEICGGEDGRSAAEPPEYRGTAGSAPRDGSCPPPAPDCEGGKVRRKLYRDVDDKILGGVLSGLAIYLGWDVTLLRVAVVGLLLFTRLPLVLAYIIMWVVVPPADTPRRRLEMMGERVTVDNVGQTVLSSVNAGNGGSKSGLVDFLTTVMRVGAKLLIGIIGIGAAIAVIAMVAGVIFGSMTLAGVALGGLSYGSTLLNLSPDVTATFPSLGLLTVAGAIALIIPAIALVWGACCALFNTRGASRSLIIGAVTIEIIALVVAGIAMGSVLPVLMGELAI